MFGSCNRNLCSSMCTKTVFTLRYMYVVQAVSYTHLTLPTIYSV